MANRAFWLELLQTSFEAQALLRMLRLEMRLTNDHPAPCHQSNGPMQTLNPHGPVRNQKARVAYAALRRRHARTPIAPAAITPRSATVEGSGTWPARIGAPVFS